MLIYTPERKAEVIEYVLGELAKGRALSTICEEDKDVCSYAHWMRWQAESDDLRDRVAHAREDGATKLLEEIVTISDERNGDLRIEYVDGKPVAKIDGDTVQRAKLRVYAREKYAAMIAPRKFGQKLDVTSGGKPLPAAQTVIQQDNRINALLLLAQQRKDQGVLLEGESSPVDDGLGDIMS